MAHSHAASDTIEQDPTTRRAIDKLIFVFAADSGLLSAAMDSAKKLLRLNGCALCSITHGLAGETSEWQSCREEIGIPVDYVHRDEVEGKLADALGGEMPAVVAQTGDDLVLLLTSEVLDRCRGSVNDLKGRLKFYASMKQLRAPF